MTKLTRNYRVFFWYTFLVLQSFLFLHLFVFPYGEFHNFQLYYNIHFLIVNVCFLMASCMDPGYSKSPKEKLHFEKLVETLNPDGLCPTCETVFKSDSRHCYQCDKCIDGFDHHCAWINNCVGRKNHKIFYFYLVSLETYFISMTIFCFVFIDFVFKQRYLEHPHLDWSIEPWYATDDPAEAARNVADAQTMAFLTLVECLILSITFLFPLTYLVIIQTQNVWFDTTTAARFSKRKKTSQ